MSVATAAPVRACPFCSADVPAEVALCGGCGRFSRPTVGGAARTILERANGAIASWEAAHAERIDAVRDRIGSLPGLPATPRRLLGWTLMALSAPLTWDGLRSGGFANARYAAALLITGMALLTWPRLLRREEVQGGSTNGTSLALLGGGIDLLVAQLLAVAVMGICAARAEIDEAWWAGIATLCLTPLLYGTPRRRLSLVLAALATIYLLYAWLASDIAYRIDSDQYARELPALVVPVAPIVWTTMGLALVPQLRLIRFGRFGIGRLHGDVTARLAGSEVLVAFTSSILLCCAWQAAWLLLTVSQWLPAMLGMA